MNQYKKEIAAGRYYVHNTNSSPSQTVVTEPENKQKRKKFKKLKTVSGDELMKKTVKPVRFVVKDLLPHGLNIVAGKRKEASLGLCLTCVFLSRREKRFSIMIPSKERFCILIWKIPRQDCSNVRERSETSFLLIFMK